MCCLTLHGSSFHVRVARNTKLRRANSVRTLGSCSWPSSVARVRRQDTSERRTTRSRNNSDAQGALIKWRMAAISRSAISSSTLHHGGTLRHVNNSLPGPLNEGSVHGNGSRQSHNWLSALAEPFVTVLAHGNGVNIADAGKPGLPPQGVGYTWVASAVS